LDVAQWKGEGLGVTPECIFHESAGKSSASQEKQNSCMIFAVRLVERGEGVDSKGTLKKRRKLTRKGEEGILV